MLDYKCVLVEVPARNTSTDCSRCGTAIQKSLAIRIHRCNKCGLVLDRDHNASINILKKGLAIFGIILKYDHLSNELPQGLREITPVEILRRSRKQEATTLTNGSSLSYAL